MPTSDCFEKHPFWDNHIDDTAKQQSKAEQLHQRHIGSHMECKNNHSLQV